MDCSVKKNEFNKYYKSSLNFHAETQILWYDPVKKFSKIFYHISFNPPFPKSFLLLQIFFSLSVLYLRGILIIYMAAVEVQVSAVCHAGIVI